MQSINFQELRVLRLLPTNKWCRSGIKDDDPKYKKVMNSLMAQDKIKSRIHSIIFSGHPTDIDKMEIAHSFKLKKLDNKDSRILQKMEIIKV